MIPLGVLAASAGRVVTPPGDYDPHWANVASLLHFDGADGSTVMLDQKGVSWRRAGNAELDTAQPKFGTSALYLRDANSALLADSPNFAFGTEDFTVEFWLRVSALGGSDANILYFGASSDTSNAAAGVYVVNNAGGELRYWTNGGPIISGPQIVDSIYRHVAVSRQSGVTRLFVNGAQYGTELQSALNVSGQFIQVGRYAAGYYTPPVHLDDLRITKGVGRYAANFAPPAGPFPDGDYTTMNPADKSAALTLSGGNLSVTATATGSGIVRSVHPINGKRYFEAVYAAGVDIGATIAAGVATSAHALTASLGYANPNGWAFWGREAGARHDGVTAIHGGSVPGDVFGFAVDEPGHKMWIRKNGVWLQGDPAAGSLPIWSNLSGTLYAAACPWVAGFVIVMRFNPASFSHAAPAGFLPIMEP